MRRRPRRPRPPGHRGPSTGVSPTGSTSAGSTPATTSAAARTAGRGRAEPSRILNATAAAVGQTGRVDPVGAVLGHEPGDRLHEPRGVPAGPRDVPGVRRTSPCPTRASSPSPDASARRTTGPARAASWRTAGRRSRRPSSAPPGRPVSSPITSRVATLQRVLGVEVVRRWTSRPRRTWPACPACLPEQFCVSGSVPCPSARHCHAESASSGQSGVFRRSSAPRPGSGEQTSDDVEVPRLGVVAGAHERERGAVDVQPRAEHRDRLQRLERRPRPDGPVGVAEHQPLRPVGREHDHVAGVHGLDESPAQHPRERDRAGADVGHAHQPPDGPLGPPGPTTARVRRDGRLDVHEVDDGAHRGEQGQERRQVRHARDRDHAERDGRGGADDRAPEALGPLARLRERARGPPRAGR